jgi:ABC-2 type transport system permease protein
MSTASALPADALGPSASARPLDGVRRVYRAEVRKLSSQVVIRVVALLCVVVPFIFAALLKVQSGAPTDTLYGVWVHSTGFAVSLVVLASAAAWGVPLIAGTVAGDMFSSEDRYGTWKLVLTRSCTRSDIFAGKLLAAATFVIGLQLLTALASMAAGVVLVGAQSMVNLNGTLFSPGHAALLVFISWLTLIPPMLAFTAIAVLLSIATRNGIIGVIAPFALALAMQLLLLVGTGIWSHLLLIGAAVFTWHGLFDAHPYVGPLLVGIAVSVIWTVVCIDVSWALLRRRDFAGTPVTRRQGWGTPVRVVVAITAAVALIAIAGNWGPAGVTAKRLRTPHGAPAKGARQARSGGGEAHARASDLQPPGQRPVRPRRMDMHDLRADTFVRGAALGAYGRRLRRQRQLGRLLQGAVPPGVHRPADDARCARPQRGQPALHDLRLL